MKGLDERLTIVEAPSCRLEVEAVIGEDEIIDMRVERTVCVLCEVLNLLGR